MSTDDTQVQLPNDAPETVAPADSSKPVDSKEPQEATASNNDSEQVVLASTSDGNVVVEAEPDVLSRPSSKEPDADAATAIPARQPEPLPADVPAVLEQLQDTLTSTAQASTGSGALGSGSKSNLDLDSTAGSTTDRTDGMARANAQADIATTSTTTDDAPPATSAPGLQEQASAAEPAPQSAIATIDSTAADSNPASSAMQPSLSTASASSAAMPTSGTFTPPAVAGTASSPSKPALPKKFTSSLSMNKKFLEKAGAAAAAAGSDGKSPQLASLPLPKPGISTARSPGLASPAAPGSAASPGATASPTLAIAATSSLAVPSPAAATATSPSASSSHPRLLTGKLSTLGSGSGIAGPGGSSTATWGRPGASAAGASGTAFGGRSGFVPAPPVSADPSSGPIRGVGGFARGRGFAFGRGGAAVGPGAGRGAASPWLTGRGGGPMHAAAPPRMENEFPSFQETRQAEQQRLNALAAKEKAEKLAQAAAEAYNQSVLERLKGFSGQHSVSGGINWDELDDEEGPLDDVLEFADGTRYDFHQAEVPPPPAAVAQEEVIGYITPLWDGDIVKQHQWIAQEKEQRLSDAKEFGAAEAMERAKKRAQVEVEQSGPDGYMVVAEEHYQYFEQEAKEVAEARAKEGAGNAEQGAAPAAPTDEYQRSAAGPAGQASVGRGAPPKTLFNDRLGRFEPYAGKPAPNVAKKDQKPNVAQPASVLQRPGGGRHPSDNAPAKAGTQLQKPSVNGAPAGSAGKAGPSGVKSPEVAQQKPKAPTSNPWAKLPPVEKVPVGSIVPDSPPKGAAAQQAASKAQPAPAPAPPAIPAEDREEAYKKEMQAIADRARKRREAEEAERQAAIERAKAKAAEFAAAAAVKSPPAPEPKKILQQSPKQPQQKSLQQESWRKPVVEAAAPQAPQQRTLLQAPARQQQPAAPANAPAAAKAVESKVPQSQLSASAASPTTAKAPSSAAFAALADFATAGWRKPSATGAPASASPPSEQPDAPRPTEQAGPSSSAAPAPAPRVKMGKSTPPPAQSTESILLAHAFPQPTILVPGSSSAAATAPQQLNDFDKVMSKLRSAQKDLKSRPAAPAQQPSGPITLSDWRAKPKPASVLAPPQMRIPAYVPEIFEASSLERPATPRSWNIFKVKVPSRKRESAAPIPGWQLKLFESPKIPFPPIFPTSWIQPKGAKLPRHTMVEDYLNPPPKEGEMPRVKVGRLHLPSTQAEFEEQTPEADRRGSTSGAIGVSPEPSTSQWRRVSLSGTPDVPITPIEVRVTTESVTVGEGPSGFARAIESVFEDFTTMPLEEEAAGPSIRVSLPRAAKVSLPAPQARAAPLHLAAPAPMSVIGAHLAELGAAVAHSAPAVDVATVRLPSDSRASSRAAVPLAQAVTIGADAPERGAYFQVPQNESASVDQAIQPPRYLGLSRSTETLSALRHAQTPLQPLQAQAGKLPSPTMPAFPSLSTGLGGLPRPLSPPRSTKSASSPKPAFSINDKPNIPAHVLEQLKKLNDTVSSAPLTAAPRLDSPNQFLARTASPWGMSGRVSSMPAGAGAFSLSSLDPSTSSVWSRPTEETAAALKDKYGERGAQQENSLRGIADDYPTLMPSSAQDLPITDGEQQQVPERSRIATTGLIGEAERARQGGEEREREREQERASGYKNSRIVSAPAHAAPGHAGRPRLPSASSRQGSFAYPSTYSHDGSIPSPYAVHASLPFSPVAMPATSPYSPTMAHAQPAYAQYVMAPAPYGSASTYAGANGVVYQQVPAGIDTRAMPNGTIWVPASQAGSMMNGYSAMPSPYSPPSVRTGLPTAYAGIGKYPGSTGQIGSRYSSQQYRAASGGRMDAGSPTSYVYAGAGSSPHMTHASHYAGQARQQAFSPPTFGPQSGFAAQQQQQQQPYRGNGPSSGSRFNMRRSPSGSQQQQSRQQQPLW